MSGQRHAPAAFNPQERPGIHCAGGWVWPRAGLVDGKLESRLRGYHPFAPRPLMYGPFVHRI
jgi:hypothetical protein